MDQYHEQRINSTAGQKFQISGADCQVLTVAMGGGEKLLSQPGKFIRNEMFLIDHVLLIIRLWSTPFFLRVGALMFMSPKIKMSQEMGNCSRLCVGETCCKTVFHNDTREEGFVALTPSFPAKVIPVDLNTVGKKLVAKGGAYMSHVGDVSLEANWDCCPTTCLYGGMGVARQGITGTGTVFLEAGGVVLTKVLADREVLVVDTDSIVAFQDSVHLDVRMQSSIPMCCLSGEGCFNTTLTGPGLVILQSMSFGKYRAAVMPPQQNGGDGGDGGGGGGD
jgi:uncharacterized protein (AIM24 family)